MKFIMNNAGIREDNQPFFFMEVLVVALVNFQEDFLIQKDTELSFLIKGVVEKVNLMLV